MEIRIPYGHSFQKVLIQDQFGVDVIERADSPPAADPLGCVGAALDTLLGGVQWSDFARARSVGIAVSDKTRPVPHQHLLPPLLERLTGLGIPKGAITFYIAVGTHRPMTADEFPGILPVEILKGTRVVSHDPDNEDLLMDLGTTSRGTPVRVHREYTQSDLKIVVGNIEPHQFAGFSGGVKSAAIGLAGKQTIHVNHALMTHPDSQLGAFETSPVRQDIEEIGEKMVIHLAVNAIVDPSWQIVRVLAGTPKAVMQAGVPLARQFCQVGVKSKYNLVISSPGGHPKDINLYQAQKGLAHAALVTRPGGTIILAAACPEGTGSMDYENWMSDKQSYEEILERFAAEGFRIGPHKAYQIARDASQYRLIFCSDMETAFARALLLHPVEGLQTAVDLAQADLKPGERIGILPHASSTIPTLIDPSDD